MDVALNYAHNSKWNIIMLHCNMQHHCLIYKCFWQIVYVTVHCWLKHDSLLFSYGQAGWDHPRAPKQQQYQVQSTGQTLHTEDPGPSPPEIHKSEEQHRQGGDKGSAGERKKSFDFLSVSQKIINPGNPLCNTCLSPSRCFTLRLYSSKATSATVRL